jgi:Tfp pilus assembly protein PilF
MKKFALLYALLLFAFTAYSQNPEAAAKLVEEGIALHDKGNTSGALEKYDKALEADKDNLSALHEKAYTLFSLKRYEEAISLCKKAISTHPADPQLDNIYVMYGNSLDAMGKSDEAIEVYDEGILLHPDAYMIYFNKGITLTGQEKYKEALPVFETTVMKNPRHAGSHNAIARLKAASNERVPAILALCRFLIIEPGTERSQANLQLLNELLGANVEKTGKKSITINVSPESLSDTLEDGTRKENCFSSAELILSMQGALNLSKDSKKPVQKFKESAETLFSILSETKKDNFGFFWEYYAPYFIELHDKGFTETFAYIAYSSSGMPDVDKWIKSHSDEINNFYTWSKAFNWKSN